MQDIFLLNVPPFTLTKAYDAEVIIFPHEVVVRYELEPRSSYNGQFSYAFRIFHESSPITLSDFVCWLTTDIPEEIVNVIHCIYRTSLASVCKGWACG